MIDCSTKYITNNVTNLNYFAIKVCTKLSQKQRTKTTCSTLLYCCTITKYTYGVVPKYNLTLIMCIITYCHTRLKQWKIPSSICYVLKRTLFHALLPLRNHFQLTKFIVTNKFDNEYSTISLNHQVNV